MNKRGEEIVEAAMVLPILILTILSLILLIVYYFSCLTRSSQSAQTVDTRCDAQQGLFSKSKIKQKKPHRR